MKKEKIIEKIKNGTLKYKDVSVFKKNDIDIINAHIQVATKEELTVLAKKHKNDYDVMSSIIDREPALYKVASKKLRTSYALADKAISLYGPNYAYLDKNLQDEGIFIYNAVKENNSCISLISDENLKKYSVGLDMLSINIDLWSYLDESLRNNRSFICDAVCNFPYVLKKVPGDYRDDFNVVYEAIKKDGTAIKFASERLKDQSLPVEIAVRNDGRSFQYASHRLRGNREILLDAIDTYPLALEFANATLQDDEEIVYIAAIREPKVLAFASKRLLHDDKFLKKIIDEVSDAEETIKEIKRIEARSYKLKSIRSDDVQIRNGVVFGVKPNNEALYNSIMQKSFTRFLDHLTHDELLVLDRLVKADANIIVEKIKKEGKKDLTDRDIRTIATYRKIYLRVRQLKLDEEDYDRSKVDMPKCYKLVDEAYQIADKIVTSKRPNALA